MTTTNGTGETVEGFVESANERGIKVNGEWRNASKFHPVELPDRGAQVRLELDPKGFIRTCTVLDSETRNALADGRPPSTRDREIRRQVAIKTAAQLVGAFAQTHEEVTTAHVFPLADKILAWLEQPDDEPEREPF